MGSEILRPESGESAPTSSTEVEFALVLSRMIESIKTDPEHLRSTVYELARHKLKEQFGSETPADFRQLSKALEVAIHGVESFRKNEPDIPALPPPNAAQQPRMLAAPPDDEYVRPAVSVVDVTQKPKAFKFTAPWRFLLVVAIGLAIVLAFRQQVVTIEALRNQVSRIAALPPTPKSVQPTPQERIEAARRELPEPSPLTPTTYGIYAISQEKLYELELLPGRVPDIRVAVSAAISTPSKTTLPDGHLKFIVYRRDSATNAADRADVRIIAKIGQETTFTPAGKAVLGKVENTWVIRNIAIPFRTAPKRESPDMYEVQSEEADAALPPGRYGLVIKGQAYDFSVAGEVTDRRQCLERLAASNGQFYSECQKP
jgi:hypothetical protein